MSTILTIVIFWIIFFSVSVTMHWFYSKDFVIKPMSYFDTYPFICHRCMTTWALITTYVMAGALMADLTFTLLGVTLAGLYGFGLYKREKEYFYDIEEEEDNKLEVKGFKND